MVIGVQQEIDRELQGTHYGVRNVTVTGMQRNRYRDATKRLSECNGITAGMQRNGYRNATESLWQQRHYMVPQFIGMTSSIHSLAHQLMHHPRRTVRATELDRGLQCNA